MTKAEEVMETLEGRVGTCYCGLSLISVDQRQLTCACGRRVESPPSNTWRRYNLLERSGYHRTKYSVGTPSCDRS